MCSHSHCLHRALLRERFDRRCDGGREDRSGQEQMRFHDGLPNAEHASSFDQKRSTSMTACAKAWGASCGRLSVRALETTCQSSDPLKSENATPLEVLSEYLSCADMAVPIRTTSDTETIPIASMLLRFMARSFRRVSGGRPSSASTFHVDRGIPHRILGRSAVLARDKVGRVPPRPVVLRSSRFVVAMMLLRFSQKLRQCRDLHGAESSSGKPRRDFLEQPAVAVRVAER